MSLGPTVHRACTERSVSDIDAEARLTIITRLADDSGWIIWGGLATFGSAWACVSRSWTIWRARMMSVSGLEDQHDRGEARHRLGADGLDPGNAAEHQRFHGDRDELFDLGGRQAEGLGLDLDVGREYSGSTSNGALRNCATPMTITATANPTTSSRNRRPIGRWLAS